MLGGMREQIGGGLSPDFDDLAFGPGWGFGAFAAASVHFPECGSNADSIPGKPQIISELSLTSPRPGVSGPPRTAVSRRT